MHRMLTLAVVSLALAGNARAQPNGPRPDIGIDQRLQAQTPLDLTFRAENGDEVRLGKYFGSRPVILLLAYYRCPRLCSLALNNLAASLSKIDYQAGQDFEVVIVSIDPRETLELAAAKKAAIVESFVPPNAAGGWHFLTGEEKMIRALADAVGFRYAYDLERDLYVHASGVMVLTPDGKISRYFLGIDHAPRDLQVGIDDAANSNVGSPIAEPLRMLCFAYDPASGKYTLMTMRLVQIGGAVTMCLVGCFLLRAWRRASPE